MNKVGRENTTLVYRRLLPRLAAAAVVILAINVASVLHTIHKEKSETKMSVYNALSTQMGFESSNNY